MSALDTLINNTSGLVIHMPLTDASGAATPAKAGPLAAGLTTSWGVGAVLGAPAIVPGDAFSTSLPNVASSFARIATGTDILQAGDLAVEGFFQPDALANANLMSNAHVIVASGVSGTISGTVVDANGVNFNAVTPTGLVYAANDILHIVVQRIGGRVQCYVNGLMAKTVGNMIAATRNSASNWTVGGSSIGLGLKVAHVAYYSRGLEPGEIRARADFAGLIPATVGMQDRTSNARSRAVAIGTTTYDGGTGFKMSSNEVHVLKASNNLTYHPGSLAATKPDVSYAAISATSTKPEVTAAAGRLVLEMLLAWIPKRGTSDVIYLDDTGRLFTAGPETDWFSNTAVAKAAAYIHRYGGGGRYSWGYQIATRMIEYVLAKQQTTGAQVGRIGDSTTGAANYLVLDDIILAMLALYPSLPKSTRTRWTTAITAAIGYDYANERLWYTNGNIEIGTACDYHLYYQLTGDPVWAARHETQLAWAASPPAGVLGTPSQGGTFGWVETVTPTLADGSDGAGYFKESNLTVPPGLDWNYCSAQGGICAEHYRLTGDIRFLKYANMCWNTLEGMGQGGTSRWTKNVASEWTLNGTGGTRIPGATLFADVPLPQILAYKGGRTALNADAAGMQRSLAFVSRANYSGQGLVINWLGSAVAEVMACATDFPDIRLR